jgi:hypothetical protein
MAPVQAQAAILIAKGKIPATEGVSASGRHRKSRRTRRLHPNYLLGMQLRPVIGREGSAARLPEILGWGANAQVLATWIVHGPYLPQARAELIRPRIRV